MSRMEFHRRDDGFELTGTLKFKNSREIQDFCFKLMQYPSLLMFQPGCEPKRPGSPMIIDDECDEVTQCANG